LAPNFKVAIGYVEYAHQNHGKIFVRVGEAIGFDDLHNMNQTNSETAGQVMTWQAAGYGQFVTPPYPIVRKSSVPQSVTGTTAQTILQSIYIPANTFAAGDIIECRYRMTKVGTAGGWVGRINVNTSNAIAGATIIQGNSMTSAILFASYLRHLNIINAVTQTQHWAVTSSVALDIVTPSTTAVTLTAIDWTVDQYIFTTISLSSALDTGQSSYLLVTKY
jgi:hypothetical protein